MRKIDLTGRVVGMLRVLSEAGRVFRNGKSLLAWRCECACGKQVDVLGVYLARGTSRSCGCQKKKRGPYKVPRHRLATETAAINSIQSQYICRARRLGQDYTLTREQFIQLISVPCHYCGEENSAKWVRRGRTFAYTGIDRVDSSLGYAMGNVVPCCTYCNRAKSNQTTAEFLERTRKVYEKHILVQDGKEALREEARRLGL